MHLVNLPPHIQSPRNLTWFLHLPCILIFCHFSHSCLYLECLSSSFSDWNVAHLPLPKLLVETFPDLLSGCHKAIYYYLHNGLYLDVIRYHIVKQSMILEPASEDFFFSFIISRRWVLWRQRAHFSSITYCTQMNRT